MKAKEIAYNGILASLYVVLTLINPIGWGAIQFRISEILAVLPFFKMKSALGIIVGVLVANAFSPLGAIDMLFGVSVVIISYSLSLVISNKWVNAIQYSVIAGAVIGLEIMLVYEISWVLSALSIFASTLMTSIIGVILFSSIEKKL